MNVAVGNGDVEAAVEVGVDEDCAELQTEQAGCAKAGGEGGFLKMHLALVQE